MSEAAPAEAESGSGFKMPAFLRGAASEQTEAPAEAESGSGFKMPAFLGGAASEQTEEAKSGFKLPAFMSPSTAKEQPSAAEAEAVETSGVASGGASQTDTFFAKIADDMIGEGADDALRRLSSLSKEVFVDLFGPGAYDALNYSITMNAALIATQVSREKRYPHPPSSGVAFTDASVLHAGARYACFAHAAYSDGKEKIAHELGLEEQHIHFVHKSSGVGCPNFVIATDPVACALVVSIRGSASLADALTDATAKSEPFLGGHAHAGILKAARQVAEIAFPIIQSLFFEKLLRFFDGERPPSQLVITGHSLGASTAILAMICLCGEGGPLHTFSRTGAVKCYAYAPSPPFEPAHKVPRWVHANTYCFIHRFDMIPRTTLNSMMKLLLAVKEVDGMEQISSSDRVAYLLAPEGLRPTLPHLRDHIETSAETKAKWGSMLGIGTLLLLTEKDGPPPVRKTWLGRALSIATLGTVSLGVRTGVVSVEAAAAATAAAVAVAAGAPAAAEGAPAGGSSTKPSVLDLFKSKRKPPPKQKHMTVEAVSPQLLDFIVLAPTAVSDHATSAYMDATARVAGLPAGLGAKAMWAAAPSTLGELRKQWRLLRPVQLQLSAPSLPGPSDVTWSAGLVAGVLSLLALMLSAGVPVLRERVPELVKAVLRGVRAAPS